jgi:chromosome segregation ATPase
MSEHHCCNKDCKYEVERLRARLEDRQNTVEVLMNRVEDAEKLIEILRHSDDSIHKAASDNAERANKAEAENESLRAEVAEAKENWCPKAERDNALQEVERLHAVIEDDILHYTRLRKAVNWLRGALHDLGLEYEQQFKELNDTGHHGTVDDCEQWECQRARAVLEEEKG